MIDEDEDDSGIYYTMNFETKIVRVLENLLIPSQIKIKVEVGPDVDMHSLTMAKATLKIKAWIDSVLNSSICLSSDNNEASQMFFDKDGLPRAGNNIMLTPGTPTDDLLAVLLQAKFDALAQGDGDTFTMCEVRSDNVLGLRSTFVGSAGLFLPSNEAWIGPRSFFKDPWWDRDDISTLDVVPGPDADLSEVPEWARPIATPGFDFSMSSAAHAAPEASEKGTSVILRPNFRPKVIDGGKSPDKPDA